MPYRNGDESKWWGVALVFAVLLAIVAFGWLLAID